MNTVADLPLLASGKVREMYRLDGEILMVASDRISTYDVVHPTPIPDKGKVLTGLSAFWFRRTVDLVPNHFVSATEDVPAEVRGRALTVRRLEMLPLECVVRGYLSGSGWKDYQENVDLDRAAAIVGDRALVERLRHVSIDLYRHAADHARARGIILADTKFEFGWDANGLLTLGDEVLTPDSSRFWPADSYEPGRPQPSFDKQYVRDWAAGSGWDKTPPAPALPDDVVARTREKYVQAYERITGEPFAAWLERTS